MRAVLERDFLFQASRPRAVALRTILAAVVSAAACLAFWIGTEEAGVSADRIGSTVFITGSVSLLALLALLTPPLVVGSILEERQDDTLLLVLATPIGCRAFAAAKLLSRWGVCLLLAFAALPALALGLLFGGVSGTQLVALVATALALSLEMAAWATWISSVSRRLATGVILAFVLPLARWVGTGFLLAWLGNSPAARGSPLGRCTTAGVAVSCPLGPVAEMIEAGTMRHLTQSRGTSPGGLEGLLHAQPWWFYLAFAVLAAAAAVAAAGARLRREAEPRDSLLGRTKTGRRWFRGHPPAGNPVVWKEVRLLNTSSSRPLFYGVMAVLVLVFTLGITALQDERSIAGLLAAMLTLVGLVAAVQGAAAIGQERTQGGYDLLRASLLTPGQIMTGKLAGVFTGIGFLAAVPVCGALLGWATGGLGFTGLLGVLAAVVLFPGSWGLAGMWLGVRAPTPRAAVVRAVAVFAVFLVGLPVLAGVLALTRIADNDLSEFLLMGSPPATSWGFMEACRGSRWLGDAGSHCLLWSGVWAAASILAVLLLPRVLARRMDEDRGAGPRFR